jgi:hypothetical protein
MGKLQTMFVAMNIILIIATIIALPVGKHLSSERNDAHFIFAATENLTTWPTGWAFMLAWLSPIWTIGAFDSCVHMSEEAANAAKAVPYGIMMAIGTAWSLGFIIMIVLAACINPDLADLLRRHWQARNIGYDVPPIHRPIRNGPLHSCCSFTSDLGLFPRWCSPVLFFLQAYLEARGIHSPPYDLGLRIHGRHSRSPLPHRSSRCICSFLACCRWEQSSMGYTHFLPSRMGPA